MLQLLQFFSKKTCLYGITQCSVAQFLLSDICASSEAKNSD